MMKFLANVIWILCGGLFIAAGWVVDGIVCCITVVGIPLGMQCFKAASLTLAPFGKHVVWTGGAGSAIANFFWIILTGWLLALSYLFAGVLNCATIIGIPAGLQSFKLAKLAWSPFGAQIVTDGQIEAAVR